MGFRTVADDTEVGWPSGIPHIVGNEASERFSFYGMKFILWPYLVFLYCQEAGLGEACGDVEGLSESGPGKLLASHATSTVHLFIAGVYAMPIVGAWVADRVLGKYRTILWLSLLYCLGHGILAFFEGALFWVYVGLACIAVGSGGIKPCVSAHVGDQFGAANRFRLAVVFRWFYFAINLGAFAAALLVPWARSRFGWSVAFGIPGVLMAFATWVFWLGRHRFVHVPPTRGPFWGSVADRGMLLRICGLFLFVAVFWALFDQHASSWMQQGGAMERRVGRFEILKEQMTAANPVLVMLLLPFSSRVLQPLMAQWGFRTDAFFWMRLGMWIAAVAFVVVAGLQWLLDHGAMVHILWQLLGYVLMTLAEVLVSVTSLEFAYRQAPHGHKSLVMGVWCLAIAVGNAGTAIAALLSGLSLFGFFLSFAGLMALTAIAFGNVVPLLFPGKESARSSNGVA